MAVEEERTKQEEEEYLDEEGNPFWQKFFKPNYFDDTEVPDNRKLRAIMGSSEQKEEYQKLNAEIMKIKMLDKEIAVTNHKYRAMKQVEK